LCKYTYESSILAKSTSFQALRAHVNNDTVTRDTEMLIEMMYLTSDDLR